MLKNATYLNYWCNFCTVTLDLSIEYLLFVAVLPSVEVPILLFPISFEASTGFQLAMLIAAGCLSLLILVRAAIAGLKLRQIHLSRHSIDDGISEVFERCCDTTGVTANISCHLSAYAQAPMTYRLSGHFVILP